MTGSFLRIVRVCISVEHRCVYIAIAIGRDLCSVIYNRLAVGIDCFKFKDHEFENNFQL